MRKKFFLMVNVEQKIALMMVWQLAMQNVLQMIGSTRKYLKLTYRKTFNKSRLLIFSFWIFNRLSLKVDSYTMQI